jgi:hypothetical protein
MQYNHSFLAEPPKPGIFKTCPRCRARFALQQIARRLDDRAVQINVFRCKKCGETTEFAERHPPDAI